MATIQVPFELPVEFIDDLVLGMAMDMQVSPPITDQEKLALFQEWVKYSAKIAICNARFQEASRQVVTSDVDEW